MSAPIQFSPKISEAVEQWQLASKNLERAKAQLEDAQAASDLHGRILGSLLVPSFAKENEIFSMWMGDVLIECWGTNGPYGMEYHTRNRTE